MKPYSDYSAEELAMENLFIRWVRFPDDPSIRTFWENWIVKYPYMKANVERARELVLTASDWKPDSLSNQEVNSLWGRIRNSLEIIGERETYDPEDKFFSLRSWTGRLVTILGLVVFLFFVVYFVTK
ncbi:hypothetical protein DSL64_06715 [Dyadobacter luteus]|jgi:hypothetical protein|uniref:Uncharacterized protein n=1 Tax=Dyadobacter luteus TaxID=2259619 RepID=A0A3D8YF91_9BACT|nr:hypothetical protein [Dyadobacter luteus]REA63299.1 hypothetical protein DSL64_06715 [Dyadobacter luteus]